MQKYKRVWKRENVCVEGLSYKKQKSCNSLLSVFRQEEILLQLRGCVKSAFDDCVIARLTRNPSP